MKKGRTAHRDSDRSILRRAFGMMVILGALIFIPVVGMLAKLMLADHDKYEAKAIRNQTRSTSITASRGVVYDRNMNVLAASATVENVFLDPLEMQQYGEDPELIADFLSQTLEGVSRERVLELAADTSMRYKVVARKQTSDITDQIRAFKTENNIKSIHMETDSRRYYPFGTLAAQLIGFVNNENIGVEGLESYYNSFLEGTAGAVIATRGNHETEMLYSYEKYYAAEDGDSVVLTIDAQVQQCLEKNMQAAVEKYDVQNGAFGIVMNVNSGEVLAMATLGAYDPNNYLEIYDTQTMERLSQMKQEAQQYPEGSAAYEQAIQKYYDAYNAAQLGQWRNRNVSDGYEPGSTFKLVTLAAALDSGSVSQSNTYFCGGAEKIPGRAKVLNCWRHAGHGSETLAQALQNSCNLAFAHIGLQTGGETLCDYIEAFGLTERTGIDLPGEGAGYFYDRELLENTEKFGTSYLTSTAFGQTFRITPIQLVRAVAAIVNGGYVLEPYVVSQVMDEEGEVVEKHTRTVLRQAISEETSATMCQMMESVVTDGTASNAQLAGYRIGGKTGTGEKIDTVDENGNPVDDKIVSFIGVAPMDEPKYVVLVALDTPSKQTGFYISGGIMGAPTVRDVFEDILPYLGVRPDYSGVDAAEINVVMPDVTGQTEQEAAASLKEKSLDWRVVGTGDTVTDQIPAAGMELPGNSQVILYKGVEKPTTTVTVPNLMGLTLAQVNDTIIPLGLYVQTKGASIRSGATVTSQDLPPNSEAPLGATVTVELTDPAAQD